MRQLNLALLYLLVILGSLLFFMVTGLAAEADQGTIKMIREIAMSEGVNPELAVAIAKVESGLDEDALGSHGEVGIYQLHPRFHAVNKRDVRDQVIVAIRYLKEVQTACEPKYGSAWFVCYNVGPNHIGQIARPESFPYYVKVMAEMKVLTQARLAGRVK